MKILLKVLVFSIVSFATWMATSAIVAQQQSKKRVAQPQIPPQDGEVLNSVMRKTKFRPGFVATPVKLGSSGAYAEGHLRSADIRIEDGVATVTAHVSLADKRPGMSYIWRLRVVDNHENPIAGHVYDRQMFAVEDNGEKEADFRDVVEVPPNAYRIELVLYAKAAGDDLSFLDDHSTARDHQMLRWVKLVGK